MTLLHGLKKKKRYLDLTSKRFRIHTVLKNFRSGERIQKVAGSYAGYTGYVWTEAESSKKKLRVQKYPDTCGRGFDCPLNIPSFISALGKVRRGVPRDALLNAPANI